MISQSKNYRFNPHTGRHYPVLISGEICTPYYFSEFNDYGFLLTESPSGAVNVIRSGSVTFTQVSGTPGTGQFAVDESTGYVRLTSGDCSGVFLATYQGYGRITQDNVEVWSGLPTIHNQLTLSDDTAIAELVKRAQRSFSYNFYTSGDYRTQAGAQSSTNNNQWYYCGYGSGFLAVAITGTDRLNFSTDGVQWSKRAASQDNTFAGVAYSPTFSGGLFAIISSDGTRKIQTSRDTQQWTTHNVGSNAYRDIAYGNGTFVCVGDTDVLRSEDGQNWTAVSAANDNQFMSVCYSPTLGRFCAVGNVNTSNPVVMTSDDNGQTWTARTAAGGVAHAWDGVAWSEDLQKFAAVSAGSFLIMYSSDGITWTLANTPASSSYRRVAAGNGLFVFTTYTKTIYTTRDLVNFIKHETSESNSWAGIAYGDGRFVTVSFTGLNRTAYTQFVQSLL